MAEVDTRGKGAGIMVPPSLTIPPAFHEQWFDAPSCAVLAAIGETVTIPGDVIEVGSWEGRSTIALANAVYPRNVIAVDTWAGSPGEISERLAARRDVYTQFAANIRHGTRGNVIPYVMDWREYVRDEMGDARAALVFLDGLHTYDEVRAQLAAFVPRIAPGGVICGDDAHHPPVWRAVCDAFPTTTIKRAATLWIVKR